ncbi:cysteine-rich RLK (RECEPTOR protein kinase) [Trifolium repens]|nr:cysteine-rich RLK (RECEPTOR protein kinase) [Trifolium repens]
MRANGGIRTSIFGITQSQAPETGLPRSQSYVVAQPRSSSSSIVTTIALVAAAIGHPRHRFVPPTLQLFDEMPMCQVVLPETLDDKSFDFPAVLCGRYSDEEFFYIRYKVLLLSCMVICTKAKLLKCIGYLFCHNFFVKCHSFKMKIVTRDSLQLVLVAMAKWLFIKLVLMESIMQLRVWKKRDSAQEPKTETDINTVESLRFDLSALEEATNKFSEANKLGEGGFGEVYKGSLPSG